MTAPAQGSLLVTTLNLVDGTVLPLVTDGPDAMPYELLLSRLREHQVIKGRQWDASAEGYQGQRVAVPFHAITAATEEVLPEPR